VERDARRLFHLCMHDRFLDEQRVRSVVEQVIGSGRPGTLRELTRFARLVRLEQARRSATVESAVPLTADLRARVESSLSTQYGSQLMTAFVDNPALLGGVRIRVGSDVYDRSVVGRLQALEAEFG
jgi:F-type H+-transporting ATPase subunit delta